MTEQFQQVDKFNHFNWIPQCGKTTLGQCAAPLMCKDFGESKWALLGVRLEIRLKCRCPWPGDVTSYQDGTSQGNSLGMLFILNFSISFHLQQDQIVNAVACYSLEGCGQLKG